MANEEQLSILKQDVDVWNKWREGNPNIEIDLRDADLSSIPPDETELALSHIDPQSVGSNLSRINLRRANLSRAILCGVDLTGADLSTANLRNADLREVNLSQANLSYTTLQIALLFGANLKDANLEAASLNHANFSYCNLNGANLHDAELFGVNFTAAELANCNFLGAALNNTIFGDVDLSEVLQLENVRPFGPSTIGTSTIAKSKGKISSDFLQVCGLSDWEIESVKLHDPDLSNNEFIDIQNRIFDLRQQQSLQISPLFISYSHRDEVFVNKLEGYLNEKGIRFWRDVHNAIAGRLEKQIDRAMRLNPTVLLILSENSVKSDWVEHEARTARALEKEINRDVLCPVALDDSWKNSPWSKRIMEQVMEYNILDFSSWKDDLKFEKTFNKLIDGLGIFYK